MGYDLERFVHGVIESQLICSICNSVLQDPVETPCEHFFCMACITNSLSMTQTCPTDRRPLLSAGLNKPSRLLLNLIAKLEIKCDFEENGCNMAVKLENLAKHRTTCNYNPDNNILCDQGCNLQIKRPDQARHCFEHLNNKIRGQEMELSRLSSTLISLRVENDELREAFDELQQIVFDLKLEVERLTVAPISKVRFLLSGNRDIVWQTFENMKTDRNNGILENDDLSQKAFARLSDPLTPSSPSFSLCVLNSGPWIGMGLSDGCLYLSDGRIFHNGKIVHAGEAWIEGDHIGCEIKYPENKMPEVSFYRNSEEISAISPAPLHSSFPTVWIGSIE